MFANQLQSLLVATLVRDLGGTQRGWRIAVGPVRVRDERDYPHCNWSVSPSGTVQEVAAIERLLDRVRLEHPIVRAG